MLRTIVFLCLLMLASAVIVGCHMETCAPCKGTGKGILWGNCNQCNGLGVVWTVPKEEEKQ